MLYKEVLQQYIKVPIDTISTKSEMMYVSSVLLAMEELEDKIKEKAIESYKNSCQFNCDECCQIKKDARECKCNELSDFIESLNSNIE